MVFIFPFVVLLSFFFLLLWLADIFFTIKSTAKAGWDLEVNPIMRFLLKLRRAYLVIFKAIELICFFALVYFISFQNAEYAVITLLVATGTYSMVVSNGMAIYYTSTKNVFAPSVLLFFVCTSALFFAYLAYATFANGVELFKTCSQCCENYAILKAECSTAANPLQAMNTTSNPELNIPIPG